MRDLAAENGVARSTIYEWLLAGVGDEKYNDLVTRALVRRVSESDEALENPEIEPDTTRAHARAKFARLDLERRRPALYGAKSESKLDVGLRVEFVSFDHVQDGGSGRVIEAEPAAKSVEHRGTSSNTA